MSTVPEDPDFADPDAVHPLLPARTRWPTRECPVPPPLPPWTAPDHRMAHVAIAMGALLLCVSAWTNGLIILSDLAATLPRRFDERGGVVYHDAQMAETIRLSACSMFAHGATLVFLVLASITGARGHRTAALLLFWPVFLGVLLAMAAGMKALEYFGR